MWTSDTGDGWYRNPVLFADWSDPDVVRVGGDYYLVASSFNRVPGLPLLHSTDLVSWRLIGHALDRLVPEDFFATVRPGCGVWAPSIRFHAGRFWICYPDPDHGIFVTTAADPAGPWTPPRLVLPGRGLIDPCPLWDDDGRAYLVHAWARSRSGFHNRLTAHRMTPDLDRPLDSGTLLVDGDAITGCHTLEGPKWYRRDGWYWIFAPAGGVATGWQYAMRSRHVLGPYEPRVVLAGGDTGVNGPHQGAWVGTGTGEDWFLHFQDLGPYGRVVHLQPMRWDAGGWPVLGAGGTPVPRHRKPKTPSQPPSPYAPAVADAFPGGVPGPQWTWPANPGRGWLLDPGRRAGLRMACLPWPDDDLRTVPAVLGQRLPGPRPTVRTSLRLDAPEGSRAGLLVCGHTYAWIGLERRHDGTFLVCRSADRDPVAPTAPQDGPSARLPLAATGLDLAPSRPTRDTAEPDPAPPTRPTLDTAEPDPAPPTGPTLSAVELDLMPPVLVPDGESVRLTLTVSDGAVVHFGGVGPSFAATPGRWIGATIGLFATGAGGHADFDAFECSADE